VRLVVQPTLEAVIEANRLVCQEGGNPHQCLNTGKIESAIASAFYPGSYPFAHGGFAKVADFKGKKLNGAQDWSRIRHFPLIKASGKDHIPRRKSHFKSVCPLFLFCSVLFCSVP
jgi:hypothetical protein